MIKILLFVWVWHLLSPTHLNITKTKYAATHLCLSNQNFRSCANKTFMGEISFLIAYISHAMQAILTHSASTYTVFYISCRIYNELQVDMEAMFSLEVYQQLHHKSCITMARACYDQHLWSSRMPSVTVAGVRTVQDVLSCLVVAFILVWDNAQTFSKYTFHRTNQYWNS